MKSCFHSWRCKMYMRWGRTPQVSTSPDTSHTWPNISAAVETPPPPAQCSVIKGLSVATPLYKTHINIPPSSDWGACFLQQLVSPRVKMLILFQEIGTSHFNPLCTMQDPPHTHTHLFPFCTVDFISNSFCRSQSSRSLAQRWTHGHNQSH